MKTPPGTEVRLGLLADRGGYFVFLAAPPLTAGTHLLDQLGRPGALTALLTHDAGMQWTDRKASPWRRPRWLRAAVSSCSLRP